VEQEIHLQLVRLKEILEDQQVLLQDIMVLEVVEQVLLAVGTPTGTVLLVERWSLQMLQFRSKSGCRIMEEVEVVATGDWTTWRNGGLGGGGNAGHF
jgi:hypothetical protein